jgi:hypothetical protein
VRGLARERAQHLAELERHVERPRGAHERPVVRRAGGAAVLGLEPGQARRRDVGQRLGGGDLGRGELAHGVREQDRDVPHLAAVRDGDEQGGGDVEVLDHLGADLARAAGVWHVQGGAGGDDPRDSGRAAVERHRVARQRGGRDRRLAAAAVLRDLEQVDLVRGQRRLEGVVQRGDELRGAARLGGRARDAARWDGGEDLALA